MSIKEIAKKSKIIRNVYYKIVEWKYNIATLISPKLNTKMRYKKVFGKRLDLENPKTFNEKIMWLKLNCYIKDPLVIKCADKYRVREYVEECGYKDILIDLIGVYDNAKDIPWEDLPNQFVLKWNYGAGMNIICTDKAEMDKNEVIRQMEKWRKNKIWLPYAELQYKYTPPKIVCETILNDN